MNAFGRRGMELCERRLLGARIADGKKRLAVDAEVGANVVGVDGSHGGHVRCEGDGALGDRSVEAVSRTGRRTGRTECMGRLDPSGGAQRA